MRSISLSLLAVLLLSAAIQAEEAPAPADPSPTQAPASVTSPNPAQITELEQRLAQSEQARGELEDKNAALLQRLRQENQRLRLQLKESQAQAQPPGLLSEEQTWFALGGALCLVSLLLGALLRGHRKPQRGWIN